MLGPPSKIKFINPLLALIPTAKGSREWVAIWTKVIDLINQHLADNTIQFDDKVLPLYDEVRAIGKAMQAEQGGAR